MDETAPATMPHRTLITQQLGSDRLMEVILFLL